MHEIALYEDFSIKLTRYAFRFFVIFLDEMQEGT